MEWIEKIPNDWKITKIGNVSKIITGNTPSMHLRELYYTLDTNGFPWVKPSDLNCNNESTDNTEVYLTEKGKEQARPVPKDSIMLCCIGSIGKYSISSREVATNQQINSIVFNKEIIPRYGFYYIGVIGNFLLEQANYVTLAIINKTELGRQKILLPPLSEQRIISKYLLCKTNKINKLVRKIEVKVKRLQEQRKSLINKCITRGLDQSIEMKDSGVEWIGEIPKHWNAVKLKYLTTHNDETLSNNTNVDYRFYYLQIGDVSYLEKVTVSEKTTFEDSPASARRIVKYNDVIVSTVRINLRSIAIIPKITNLICSTAFCVLRSNQRLLVPKFLEYSVGSDLFVNLAITKSTGVAYPTISARELVEIEIAVPPIGEQEEIAEFLGSKIEQYNKLISLEAKRIGLLEEYRQSLISSAVTGKIRITEDMI